MVCMYCLCQDFTKFETLHSTLLLTRFLESSGFFKTLCERHLVPILRFPSIRHVLRLYSAFSFSSLAVLLHSVQEFKIGLDDKDFPILEQTEQQLAFTNLNNWIYHPQEYNRSFDQPQLPHKLLQPCLSKKRLSCNCVRTKAFLANTLFFVTL